MEIKDLQCQVFEESSPYACLFQPVRCDDASATNVRDGCRHVPFSGHAPDACLGEIPTLRLIYVHIICQSHVENRALPCPFPRNSFPRPGSFRRIPHELGNLSALSRPIPHLSMALRTRVGTITEETQRIHFRPGYQRESRPGKPLRLSVLGLLTYLLGTHDSQRTANFHGAFSPTYRSSAHQLQETFPPRRCPFL
jgi:hypothetical protein